MKKSEISDMLIKLWDMVDQSGYDMHIKDAFKNCPTEWQKKFIKTLLETRNWNEDFYDEEVVEKAKKTFLK